MNSVHLLENFMDKSQCDELIAGHRIAASHSQHFDGYGNPLVHWSNTQMPEAARNILLSYALKAWRLTARHFPGEKIFPDAAMIAVLQKGQGHGMHADNEKLVDGKWTANHTPHRIAAGILYLNTMDLGGELYFEKTEYRAVHPRTGLYVTFPAHNGFVHGVRPVAEGERYSAAVWYTADRRFANRRLMEAFSTHLVLN